MKSPSLIALIVSCFVLPLALLVPASTGCSGGFTAEDKAIATGILSGVTSAANAANQVGCAIVSAKGGNGTACSQDLNAASDVAQMVQNILGELPTTGMHKAAESIADAGAPLSPAAAEPMVAFKVHHKSGADVDVTLPASLAAYVQAHLPAGAL